MQTLKKLYQFNVPITKTVEIPVDKEIDGKKVTVLEKTEEVQQKAYFIKKPVRSEYEEAELFHDIKFGNDVRSGVLTKSEIIKRFANEDVEIKKTYENYGAKENELQRLLLLDRSDENIIRRKKIEDELLLILIDIQNFELTKSSAFSHTAENRARNKTIVWWILNLAYKIEEDKELPIFEGEDFEAKQESYDKIITEENEHIRDVIQRFFYLVPAWYTGDLNTEKDFKKAEDLLKAEMTKQKEEQLKLEAERKEIEAKDKLEQDKAEKKTS